MHNKIIMDPKNSKVVFVPIHTDFPLSSGTRHTQLPLLVNVAPAEVGQTGTKYIWDSSLRLLLSPVLLLAL